MCKRTCVVFLLCAMLVTPQAAFAWGDTGHMVVAYIAYEKLNQSNPKAAARVDELVKLIAANYSFENKQGKTVKVFKTYDRYSIANYMDDMRDDPASEYLKPWHFTNKPFFDGIPEKKLKLPKVNVVSQIAKSLQTIRKNAGATTAKKKYLEALYLAYLFHLVGDIHQPLHCSSRYSKAHPSGVGDQGGNLFTLAGERTKLHSYWDAGGGLFNFADVRRPLKSEGIAQLKTYAEEAMAAYADTDAEWKDLNVAQWVSEGFAIAAPGAYRDTAGNMLPEGEKPDDEYQAKVKGIARKRLAMGGYRLAALLNEIYSD
ncbi:MAG TPA: S1/P1 nuclease [Pyrinomonadaceae bacterium]|nr:S1/P1 nuclease [Pyrinomonadaceae bacterium]